MACLHDPTRGMFSRWKVQICCYLWWDLRSSRSNCWNLSSNLTLYSRSIHKQTVVIQGLFLVRFHLQGGISYWGAFEPWYLPHYSLKDGFFSRWLHWVHFHSYIDIADITVYRKYVDYMGCCRYLWSLFMKVCQSYRLFWSSRRLVQGKWPGHFQLTSLTCQLRSIDLNECHYCIWHNSRSITDRF